MDKQGLVRALREGEFVSATLVLIVEVLRAARWKLLDIVLHRKVIVCVAEVLRAELRTPDFLGHQTLSTPMLELIDRL